MSMTEGLPRELSLLSEHIMLCPGCKTWQLHYTWMALSDLIRFSVPSAASLPLGYDLTEATDLIEGMLGDHVARECTHPRRVMELWKSAKKKW